MSDPRPGRAVRGSTSGRPIMALFDVLGQRWTLRVLWELHLHSPQTFRALQGRCGEISSSVLNRRLGTLREVALVRATGDGYCLSLLGEQLVEQLMPLLEWSQAWAASLADTAEPQTHPSA